MLRQVTMEQVHLLPGLFNERAQVNRAYLMELNKQGLLQNFYLEAGIVMPGLQVVDDPAAADLHWGWEAPLCQLRGHFLGHWLSAASMLVATNRDRELKAKLDVIVDELDRCRVLNGGKWIGSIPEKYFQKLEKNEYVWSPQYVMHKTHLGLLHAYVYAKNETALELISHSADWYLDWTAEMEKKNPHAVYGGEEGGMLEVWASLYQITGEEKYRILAERYSHPSIFRKLENGMDPLTNCHENASIPWAHGAAKMYEATGDVRWRSLAEKFWKSAVLDRESYCTGGQGSGEYWVGPGLLGQFLGERNQEFCTVYNMVRLADYLYRFTGDSVYAEYIEKNLYNGFLAQQNQYTGMPTYFLPMKPGSKKKWGTKTRDFWCCYGTMVQAQTIYPSLCYYEDETRNRLVVGQYISCEYKRSENITVSQSVDMKYYNDGAFFDEHDDSRMSRWFIKFTVQAQRTEKFVLSLRIPQWVKGKPLIFINDEEVAEPVIKDGYFDVDREWSNDVIRICFPVSLTTSSLPDMPEKTAFLEGPIVLAGLCDRDCGIFMEEGKPDSALTGVTEHTYSTFPWLQSTYRTVNQQEEITFVPLYDITDEAYTVYFTRRERE
ncbi:MAG: glycoside hydrolase family 127 protein [Lachnospiraceae bacterium]|nr:glycoside hydrolase family 127 protein [Lachnospiraceae bacterium]